MKDMRLYSKGITRPDEGPNSCHQLECHYLCGIFGHISRQKMGELIRKYTCIPEPECKHANSRMTNTHYSSSSLAPSMLEALPGSLYNKEHD